MSKFYDFAKTAWDSAVATAFFSFEWLLNLLKDVLFWLANQILDVLAYWLLWAASLMPTFDWFVQSLHMLGPKPSTILSYISWVVPMDVVGFTLNALALNYMLYWGGGWALRWAKIIE